MKKKSFIISESFTQKLSIGINRGAVTNKMWMLTYHLIVVGGIGISVMNLMEEFK